MKHFKPIIMALPLLCLFGCRPAPVLPSLIYSDPLDIGGAYLNDGLHRTSIAGKNVVEGNKRSSGQSLGVAIPTWHVLDDFSVKVAIGSSIMIKPMSARLSVIAIGFLLTKAN